MGDKLQALEARYNCALKKDYSNGTFQIVEDDIYVKHRLLVSQDRPLSIFAQIENNINFLSKATLKGFKIIYWNYGDAYHLKYINLHKNSTQQVDYLPLISTFSMNRIFGLNQSELDTEMKIFKDQIDEYEDFYENEINPPKPKPRKKIPPSPTKQVVTTSQIPSGTIIWRGTLPPKQMKKIIIRPITSVS